MQGPADPDFWHVLDYIRHVNVQKDVLNGCIINIENIS